jgi:O-antigen ligase
MPVQMKDWKQQLVSLVVFLFPVLTASVEDAGSIIFVILMLLGLRFGWQGWPQPDRDEQYVFIGLLAVLTVIALGLFYTPDLQEGIAKFERYLRIFLFIPVYLMLRRFDWQLGRIFLLGAMVALPVLAVQGWYQTEMLGKTIATGAYHKIVFGDVAILLTALIAVAVLTLARERKHYLFAVLLIALGCYAAILSVTRAAWLFVPLFLAGILLLYSKRISAKAWMMIGVSIIAVTLLITLIQPERLTKGFKAGVANLNTYMKDPSRGGSWGARLNMWRNSLIMFSEDPLSGKGTGSFQTENQRLIENDISYSKYIGQYGHAHSIYFHTLAENGLLGLVVMVTGLFILPFAYFYRRWKKAATPEQRFYTLGGMTCLLAFAWFGVSEMWLARNPFVNVYFMCMLVFMSGTASLFARQVSGQKA